MALQKPVQQVVVDARNERQQASEAAQNPLVFPTVAISRETLREIRLGGTGFDTPHFRSLKTNKSPQGGADSGALAAPAAVLTDAERHHDDAVADPLLARFLAAWDRLSDADRGKIVADAERRAEALSGDGIAPQ